MRLGVLDVGSNTVHLQIMDANHGSAPIAYQSFKEEIRLSEFLTAESEISDLGCKTLLATLNRLTKSLKGLEVDEILSFATSAIREATNADQVLASVFAETGIELQILSGADEAKFTFFAARRWCGWSAGDLLLLDIGGGSLEMATGNQEHPAYANSLMLGASRLTRQFLIGDPVSQGSVKKMHEHIVTTLQPVVTEIGDNSKRTAIGTSKTFRTLLRIQKNYLPELGNQLTRNGLKIIVPKLINMTQSQKSALPGVSSSRAAQITAGAIVAEVALDLLGIEEIKQCPWALREGVILQRLEWLKPE